MGIKKFLAFILILSISITLCSCKSRSGGVKEEEPLQRGAREVSAAPEAPKPQSKPAPQPESRPADEAIRITYDLTDDFFQAARTGERDLIQEYADYNELFGLIDGQEADWILQQILMRMKYEILSSTADGDKILVSVKCSNVDMGVVIPLYFEQAMSLEYNNALSDSPLEAEELEKEYRKVFAALMSSNGERRIEKLVDVELGNDGGIWKIKPEVAVGNAMLGGYHEARDKFMQTAAEAHNAQFLQPEAAQGEDAPPGDDYDYDGSEENGDDYDNYDEFSMVPPRE